MEDEIISTESREMAAGFLATQLHWRLSLVRSTNIILVSVHQSILIVGGHVLWFWFTWIICAIISSELYNLYGHRTCIYGQRCNSLKTCTPTSTHKDPYDGRQSWLIAAHPDSIYVLAS